MAYVSQVETTALDVLDGSHKEREMLIPNGNWNLSRPAHAHLIYWASYCPTQQMTFSKLNFLPPIYAGPSYQFSGHLPFYIHVVYCRIQKTKQNLIRNLRLSRRWYFKSRFSWVVTSCSVMTGYQSFRGPCCLHLQCESWTSEKLVSNHNTKQRETQKTSTWNGILLLNIQFSTNFRKYNWENRLRNTSPCWYWVIPVLSGLRDMLDLED
jgi:hypothetical protein